MYWCFNAQRRISRVRLSEVSLIFFWSYIFYLHFQWPAICNHLVFFFLKCFFTKHFALWFLLQAGSSGSRLLGRDLSLGNWLNLAPKDWPAVEWEVGWVTKKKQNWAKGRAALWNMTKSSTYPRRSSRAKMPLQNCPKLGQRRRHWCGLQQEGAWCWLWVVAPLNRKVWVVVGGESAAPCQPPVIPAAVGTQAPDLKG